MSKKALVLLSGCGVYDGSEIHESVLCLLELDKNGISVQCAAPNIQQHHVINHTDGSEINEQRNVFIESARIARGNILQAENVAMADYDALVIPGGFGAAKNFTKWAFSGPEGAINPDIKQIIQSAVELKKPILALCMSPTVVAKALEVMHQTKLTVGSTKADSPYDIAAISDGMSSIGAKAEMAKVDEIVYDDTFKIITSPCYMMEASISQIHEGIEKSVAKLAQIIS